MSNELPPVTNYDSENRCTGCSSHLSEPHSTTCPFGDISEEEAHETFERWHGYSPDAAEWNADGRHQDEPDERLADTPDTNEAKPNPDDYDDRQNFVADQFENNLKQAINGGKK